MRRNTVIFTCAVLAGLLVPVQRSYSMTPEERRDYLAKLLKILPPVPSFQQWLDKTGELPPDYDSLPKVNGLPDPLTFLNGRSVKTATDWRARRTEIWQLYQKDDLGTFPQKPKLDRVVMLDETPGNGYIIRNVRLEFGPQTKGTMRVQLMIPSGAGPFPVLISPNLQGWAPALLRRGYISAGYAGNDGMDDAAALGALYPDYDFALLPRRAWAAGLVLDYIETVPQVDMKHVGMFGYSRDGKMAAIAGALDERISAVIAGSTGVGGLLPWRLSGERNSGEGIESTTRSFPTWFVPRLRFFAGREDRLPVDGNLLAAMIAPRSLLMEYGLNDQVMNPWSMEQVYHSAEKVYKLLGQPDRLDIMRVPGFHGSNDEEACLDWLDIQFGRSHRTWTNNFLFPWDYDTWRANSKETVDLSKYPKAAPLAAASTAGWGKADWEKRAAEVRKSIQWMLGEEPARMPPAAGGRGGRGGRGPAMPQPATAEAHRGGSGPGQLAPDVISWVISNGGTSYGWLAAQAAQTVSRPVSFGYGVRGDLYFPANTPAGAKLPTVIWLHGFSYPLGYMWVYRTDLHPILALVQAGYAVLAYDQSGFGSRMGESAPFYDRCAALVADGPAWWKTRARPSTPCRRTRWSIPSTSTLFGYSLGGTVGLYAAALDDRIKGVVSISGFTPDAHGYGRRKAMAA